MARSTHQKGSVQCRKGVWSVRYRERDERGSWRWKREKLEGCETRKDALNAASRVLADVNQRNNNPALRKSQAPTFRQFVDEFWRPYAQKEGLQVSTMHTYGTILNGRLLPAFGGKQLSQITPVDVSRFFAGLSRWSANYRKTIYGLLNSIFELALQCDLIQSKPTRSKLHRPKSDAGEKPTLTVAELRALIAEMPEEHRLFLTVIAVAGLRVGEALALRWLNFDAGARTLSVTHTLWWGRLKPPKTPSSVRVLGIPEVLVDMLVARRRQSDFTAPSDFIFCRSDGRPWSPCYLRSGVLYPAMDRAGIKRKAWQYGFHILRHTFGSVVHAKTGDLKLTQKTLGHSRLSTTSDIYVHLQEGVVGAATELMAAEIFQICDHGSQEESKMVS